MTAALDPRTHDLQPWATTLLDIAGCHRLEIVVPLYDEFEKADVAPETWPEAVRAKVRQYLNEWRQANAARVLVALTTAITADSDGRPACTVIAHHKAKDRAKA